jgi:hypothetical protein
VGNGAFSKFVGFINSVKCVASEGRGKIFEKN